MSRPSSRGKPSSNGRPPYGTPDSGFQDGLLFLQGIPAYKAAVIEPRAKRSEWLLVLGGLAAMALLLVVSRGRPPEAGSTLMADITLVTVDRHRLSCALSRPVGPYRCGFATPEKGAQPVDVPEARRLAPYVTTDRILYLVPGLFQQPALLAHYEAERANRTPHHKPKRFIARCEVRLLERIDRFYTRWARNGKWATSGPAWVVEPLDCKVE